MGKYEEKVLPRLEEIGAWAADGWTERDIAVTLGVSYSGFRGYKKKQPELLGVLAENKKIADNAVKGALYQRAIGMTYTKEVKEKDKDGNTIVRKETVVVPADVQAAKFWLANRDPDNWKNRETKDVTAHVDANIEDFI